jgi:hypothetical protein
MKTFTCVIGLPLFSLVSVIAAHSSGLGISFENGQKDAALLKLDYATYKARYDNVTDVRIHFWYYYF